MGWEGGGGMGKRGGKKNQNLLYLKNSFVNFHAKNFSN